MTRTFHLCQSVTGPLRNWTKRDWKKATRYMTKDDGGRFTADELKDTFISELAKGHEVIPFGEPCEGFDYKKGCPGHPKET